MDTVTGGELLAAYRPIGPGTDEMVAPDGNLRPHWADLAGALDALGPADLARRAGAVADLLAGDGVTYNVGDVGSGGGWSLDPVPLLLPSEEWSRVENGVIQRAELLDLVLADLYGPRDLVRRGLLPPELVYGHSGFLRACDGVRLPGPHQLFTYAVDIGRGPDGVPTAMADHTQAPSGAGYALENRIVVSRTFPSLYRDSHVHRLAPFFRALRGSMAAVAPPTAAEPRIVVLTPGPWSETAFEHAFLASYLGYALVEGSDLTVRGGRVWLRSLGRLEPVDVILRRVDAAYCDPLELRPESQLGIPGLVEATRAGNVSVVNPLGSSVVESPALMAFLPDLAEPLLGQGLRLEQAPTWWCGADDGRRHVLASLERLVLRPVEAGPGSAPINGWALSEAQRDRLRRRIEAQPTQWVGQEPVTLANAPTFTAAGLQPRPMVLRAFAVARGDSYAVMPGALARVGADPEGRGPLSSRTGALSKDTWVLASEPEKLTGFWLVAGPTVPAMDPAASMSTRAAENLFWLGRYAERAEDVVRLLRATYDRRNDFPGSTNPAGAACLHALLEALTHVTTTYPGFLDPTEVAAEMLAAPGPELLSLVVDDARPGTLANGVRHLLDSASAVRDQLSGDIWLVIGNLDSDIRALGDERPDRQAAVQATLSRVLASLLALAGLAAESHVRDPGWRFMDAGRRIERGIHVAALLQATVTIARDNATDSLLYESVLTSAESIITYRRRYRSQAQLETVLDLLLMDPGNPRSLRYQLDRLGEDLAALPRVRRPAGALSPEERLALEATTAVRLLDTAALARVDDAGQRPELDAFLARVLDVLRRLADAVDTAHFAHPMPQRAL